MTRANKSSQATGAKAPILDGVGDLLLLGFVAASFPAPVPELWRYLLLTAVIPFFGCGPMQPTTPQQRFNTAQDELRTAGSEEERFYALNDAAKEGFVLGKNEEARKHAEELLTLLPKYKGNWNYGNAIQDGNLVLGRIAVVEGHLDDAKQFLIKAGNSPGSPQMNSFGPNMSLAKDLLEKGETDAVLEYFELCRKFWKMEDGKLDQWSREVKAGKIPDFGANLVY